MHFIKASMAIAAVLGVAAAQDTIALLNSEANCASDAGQAVLPGACGQLEFMKSIDVLVDEITCTAYEQDDCYDEVATIALNSGCSTLLEYPWQGSRSIMCN